MGNPFALAGRAVITGVMREGLPWLSLSLDAVSGILMVDFVIDTGFDGELAMPGNLLRRLPAQRFLDSTRKLADGTFREFPTYMLPRAWNGEPRLVEVDALEGNPLLGTGFFDGCRICVDISEGGEVEIELPG